jgi:hypothetical protein
LGCKIECFEEGGNGFESTTQFEAEFEGFGGFLGFEIWLNWRVCLR